MSDICVYKCINELSAVSDYYISYKAESPFTSLTYIIQVSNRYNNEINLIRSYQEGKTAKSCIYISDLSLNLVYILVNLKNKLNLLSLVYTIFLNSYKDGNLIMMILECISHQRRLCNCISIINI